jgi:hypothetical protein
LPSIRKVYPEILPWELHIFSKKWLQQSFMPVVINLKYNAAGCDALDALLGFGFGAVVD